MIQMPSSCSVPFCGWTMIMNVPAKCSIARASACGIVNVAMTPGAGTVLTSKIFVKLGVGGSPLPPRATTYCVAPGTADHEMVTGPNGSPLTAAKVEFRQVVGGKSVNGFRLIPPTGVGVSVGASPGILSPGTGVTFTVKPPMVV